MVFPPPPQHLASVKKGKDEFFVLFLASWFEVKGQEQHQGAVRALIHLWDEFSSTGVAATARLTFLHSR